MSAKSHNRRFDPGGQAPGNRIASPAGGDDQGRRSRRVFVTAAAQADASAPPPRPLLVNPFRKIWVRRHLVHLPEGTYFRTRTTGRVGRYIAELQDGDILLVQFAGEPVPVEVHGAFVVDHLERAA